MITATTSEGKGFAPHQVQPASREKPRIITQADIDAFERNNPALAGIGEIMVRRGLWVIADSENEGSGHGPGNGIPRRHGEDGTCQQ